MTWQEWYNFGTETDDPSTLSKVEYQVQIGRVCKFLL